jgi:hypothetical protein
MAKISLQKSERTDKLSFILKNEGEHPIYVSFLPPHEGSNTTEFLTYGLEAKTADGNLRRVARAFILVPH